MKSHSLPLKLELQWKFWGENVQAVSHWPSPWTSIEYFVLGEVEENQTIWTSISSGLMNRITKVKVSKALASFCQTCRLPGGEGVYSPQKSPELRTLPWYSWRLRQLSTRWANYMWFGDLWLFNHSAPYLSLLTKHPTSQEMLAMVWNS